MAVEQFCQLAERNDLCKTLGFRSDFGKISNKSSRTVAFTNSACGFCGSIPTLPVMAISPR